MEVVWVKRVEEWLLMGFYSWTGERAVGRLCVCACLSGAAFELSIQPEISDCLVCSLLLWVLSPLPVYLFMFVLWPGWFMVFLRFCSWKHGTVGVSSTLMLPPHCTNTTQRKERKRVQNHYVVAAHHIFTSSSSKHVQILYQSKSSSVTVLQYCIQQFALNWLHHQNVLEVSNVHMQENVGKILVPHNP